MRLRSIEIMRGWLAAAIAAVLAGAPIFLPPVAGTANAEPAFVGSYFQETSDVLAFLPPTPGACNPVNTCHVMFGRVPLGKTYLVTHVSCSVFGAGVLTEATMLSLRPNNSIPLRHFFLTPRMALDGSNLFTLNEGVLHQFRSRDLPMVKLVTDASGQILARCTIAGQVFDTP